MVLLNFLLAHALDMLMSIVRGGLQKRHLDMTETKIDYWTCMELAQALEQTMRNDLWTTADQIAETAKSIADKPEELLAALQQYELQKAANCAATEVSGTTITTLKPPTHFSKAS